MVYLSSTRTSEERSDGEAVMDRRQVEYFLAVARHGSFTGAAVELRVAQPSLSQAIRSLEREVDAALFHRLGRGIRLTPAGEALVGPAQHILRGFANATASVRQATGLIAGRLEIVALTTLTVDPLARLVGAFRRAYQGVEIRIADPEHASGVAELVRAGRVEIGLADFSVPSDGLRTAELAAQEIRVVLPPDTTIDATARLSLTDVAALEMITTPAGTSTRSLLDSVLISAGAAPRVAVETPHRAAIVPLVLAGAGSTLLPEPMASDAARQGARVVGIDPPVLRRIRLLWRPGPLSATARAFIDLAAPPDGDHAAPPDGDLTPVPCGELAPTDPGEPAHPAASLARIPMV